jgi:HJR/Mrr/RecB family endonuclease
VLHAEEYPGLIPGDVQQRIGELLEALSLRSPVDLIHDHFNQRLPSEIPHITDAIARRIADHPDLLDRLSGRAFEEFLERVLYDLGYAVELTQQTRDGGVDLFAVRHVDDISLKFVIEAKRYSKQRRVGIGVVQRLLGVKDHERASKAVLVTTTYFSKDAQKFARAHEYELDLKDYDALLRWARTYAERHQPPRRHVDELTLSKRGPAPKRRTKSPTTQDAPTLDKPKPSRGTGRKRAK